MDAVDITGSGRLRCDCGIISPSFYPNCPSCQSTRFHALDVEPTPPIRLTEDFFLSKVNLKSPEVIPIAYKEKSDRLIDSFDRKGFFLVQQREVWVNLDPDFDFLPLSVCLELGIRAMSGHFTGSFRLYQPPNDVNVLAIQPLPADVDLFGHTALCATEIEYPPLAPVLSYFDLSNLPPHLFCSICRRGDPPVVVPPDADDDVWMAPDFAGGLDDDEQVFDFDAMSTDSETDDDDDDDDDVDDDDDDDDDDDVDDDDAADPFSFIFVRPCGHMYHMDCIGELFLRQIHECPNCNRIILTDNEVFNTWASVRNRTLR